jgi:signal transduction histidine kinase
MALAPRVPDPAQRLHDRLMGEAAAIEIAGDPAAAASLRAVVEDWWTEHRAWTTRLHEALAVHHEINNALVGVRGNTQLMLMNPAGQVPGVRERLEVVLRESSRIQEATARLRELRTLLDGNEPRSRAA